MKIERRICANDKKGHRSSSDSIEKGKSWRWFDIRHSSWVLAKKRCERKGSRDFHYWDTPLDLPLFLSDMGQIIWSDPLKSKNMNYTIWYELCIKHTFCNNKCMFTFHSSWNTYCIEQFQFKGQRLKVWLPKITIFGVNYSIPFF